MILKMFYLFLVLALYLCSAKSVMENPSLFEGDMIISQVAKRYLKGQSNLFAAVRSYRWPGNSIAYEISPDFDLIGEIIINNAIAEFHRRTCLRFHLHTTEHEYINFIKDDGCYADWGYVPNTRKNVSIGTGCLYKGIVLHEISHALGVIHEHNRPDRDQYIYVNLTNVKPKEKENFELNPGADTFNLPYDLHSVMHYRGTSFSRNGLPTIVTLDPNMQSVIGQRRGFSNLDVLKLNKLYNCNTVTATKASRTTMTSVPINAPSTTRPISSTSSMFVKSGPHYSVFCQGRAQRISCASGVILIQDAIFGYSSSPTHSIYRKTCNGASPVRQINCTSHNAKHKLEAKCNRHQSCSVIVSSRILGSPVSSSSNCSGVAYYFYLQYSCI